MNIILSWIIILISYVLLVRIAEKVGIIDKFRLLVYNHCGIKLKTQKSVSFTIHMGIICTVCVIPLMSIAWEFVSLMTYGLGILYLGLGVYFRPHIFSDESLYDIPVDFGIAGLPGWKNIRRIGYYQLIYEPSGMWSVTALLLAIQLFNFIHRPQVIELLLLILFDFINITLMIFTDKLNRLFKHDIRSPEGYSTFSHISILWQLIPLFIWMFSPK
ncbi:hypothetical protein [uncultured Methanosphaera sp.]|uniref:hypothetical protein n=1 Tax=uncultured Methanosphaera sp. TaxID=262501 RepID=UPI000DC4AA85|nr:hypothetical protein [uncultured Methanosphaera sp.]RAP45393.1 MAG: hypothetical protein BZ134_01255 [Methanosphaera sp. SHI1033]